jgi:transcriptional regulator with XRE-family HTH domain
MPGSVSDRVAANVARIRRSRGMSARQLATLTAATGVPISRGTIANIEARVQRSVTVDQLIALATALDVDPAALMLEEAKVAFSRNTATP